MAEKGKFEGTVVKEILLKGTQLGHRLFRQNVGTGWTGKSTRFSRIQRVEVRPGDVLLRNARPLRAGLCTGSSDIIGWTMIKITPDMIDLQIPVFTAIEVKTRGTVLTKPQRLFIDFIKEKNGIAFVAKTIESYVEELLSWKPK